MRSGLLGSERSGGAVQCELDDEGAIRAFTMGGIRDVRTRLNDRRGEPSIVKMMQRHDQQLSH